VEDSNRNRNLRIRFMDKEILFRIGGRNFQDINLPLKHSFLLREQLVFLYNDSTMEWSPASTGTNSSTMVSYFIVLIIGDTSNGS
jgi:hypothetical protein